MRSTLRRHSAIMAVVALAVASAGWVIAHSTASPTSEGAIIPAIVHTIRFAQLPTAAVIDTRTKRLFIATVSSGSQVVDVLNTQTYRSTASVMVGHLSAALAVDQATNQIFVAGDNPTTGSPVTYVLDASSGIRLTTISMNLGLANGSIAVAPHSGRAFVASGGGTINGTMRPTLLSIMDTQAPRILSTINLGTWSQDGSMLSVDNAHARVLVAQGTQASVLDARTGHILWTVAVAPTSPDTFASALAIDQHHGRALIATIQYPARQTLLSILDMRTGKILYRLWVSGVARDAAIDPHTGHMLLSMAGPASAACPSPESCLRAPGQLVMLNDVSGRILSTKSVQPWPGAIVADASAGHAYVAGSAYLRVVNMQTGQITARVALPEDALPRFVLLDSGAHHVLIVDQLLRPSLPGSGGWDWIPAALRAFPLFQPLQETHSAR